ncbi:hypothetical protein NDU88_002329 [Pleurodeles waltl]|uniref:Uncharacterized protein n=1 Tax=Pleurodeles waltl TaxID=8319 RepID=A0AAV7UCU8_PLEWA|nr:hypothetical protein NDU88_002329 [Pleurodeles waltl]
MMGPGCSWRPGSQGLSMQTWRARAVASRPYLDEIQREAWEAVATHSKEWLLKQIQGKGFGEWPAHEVPNDNGDPEKPREETDVREQPTKAEAAR